MALVAAHLNAGHFGGDSVAINIYSPSSPTSIPPSPFSPSLISLMVSVDVKHHVYLLNYQCVSMVHYSFTSTETIRLVRTDSPGRPPRLSHSS